MSREKLDWILHLFEVQNDVGVESSDGTCFDIAETNQSSHEVEWRVSRHPERQWRIQDIIKR